MDMESSTIPIHDIYQAAYGSYKGIEVKFSKQDRRVIFHIPDTPGTYRILSEFNNNPELPLLDYITHLKRLRAVMISMRG
jgi:hypothetical protein